MKTFSQSLGRYQIEAELGRGAMGIVFRAFDPKIHRTVAIKTISLAAQEPEQERAYRERFMREARAAGRLSHPGIVPIFDAGEDAETHEPYLVMEYIPGDPLSKILISEGGKLPLNAALQLAQQIAEALAYAHTQGVIHRDIKPANILITEDGQAKIADFGVARLNQDAGAQNGEVVGSPAYMSPEQMAGREADARSDLFSLGVVLYSMITGFRPFQGNSARTVCFKVMNIEPVPVTSFQHEVPHQMNAIVARAIAKDPNDRYQSGAQMARDIQRFRESDRSLIESTGFFARVMQRNSAGSTNKLWLADGKPFWWTAAILTLIVVGLTLGLRLERNLNHADALRLPTFAAPQAPRVQKMARPTAHKVNSKTPSVHDPALPDTRAAEVELEILHHFKSARASVWLDNELVFHRELRGADNRHTLFRTVEMNQTASFRLPSGKHQLQVRVLSPSNNYDQVQIIDAELAPDSQHLLVVNCDKRKMQVALQPPVATQ